MPKSPDSTGHDEGDWASAPSSNAGECRTLEQLPDAMQLQILGFLDVRNPPFLPVCAAGVLLIVCKWCGKRVIYSGGSGDVSQARSLACVSRVCPALRRQVAAAPDLYRAAFQQRFGDKSEGGWWPLHEYENELSCCRSA